MSLTKDHLVDALALIDSVSISASDGVFTELANRLNAANAYQKDHYQDAWSLTTKRFEKACESTCNIAELLAEVEGVPSSNGIVMDAVAKNKITINMASFERTEGHMVVIKDGHHEMVPNSVTDNRLIEAVVDSVKPDTEAIIELGCGWGRNLAAAAIKIPDNDITYIGLEQAPAGLRCTKELLSRDPRIKFQTGNFDFYTPDFSILKKYKRATVFTCAAIEQIAFIGTRFIDQVLQISDEITLIFYEPFGWQRNPDHQKFAVLTALQEVMGNVPPEKEHTLNYVFDLNDNAIAANAVSWSIASRYNFNLWSVILNAVARSIVDMDRAEFDIFGLNPFNPYSLVVLNKRNFAI